MTTLRVRPLLGGRVRPGLLAPVVVGIVLGILGMHGIGAHGADLHGSLTRADAAAPLAAVMAHREPGPGDTADPHSAGVASSGDPARHAQDAEDASGGGGGGGGGGMVMMCVAMLAGAAVALLTLLVRRGRLPGVWAILGAAGRCRVPVPAVTRVGAGPPAVWRFSVIRC